MRAMILAAGRGQRMKQLTDAVPKPLLCIQQKPLIQYHIEALARAGIHEIIINVHHLGHQIEAWLKDGQRFNVQITYSYEAQLLDTGGGIVKALPLLGPDPFIVLSADIFTDFPFASLPFEPKGLVHMVMVDNPSHHQKGDYALLNDQVLESAHNRLNFAGIGVYRPELFERPPANAFPLSELFMLAIRAQKATGQYYAGRWHNVGTPEQLFSLNSTCPS